jgi:hypothetical protein
VFLLLPCATQETERRVETIGHSDYYGCGTAWDLHPAFPHRLPIAMLYYMLLSIQESDRAENKEFKEIYFVTSALLRLHSLSQLECLNPGKIKINRGNINLQ